MGGVVVHAASRNVEVVEEILTRCLLEPSLRLFDAREECHLLVDPGQPKGKALAHVSEHDLEPRVFPSGCPPEGLASLEGDGCRSTRKGCP